MFNASTEVKIEPTKIMIDLIVTFKFSNDTLNLIGNTIAQIDLEMGVFITTVFWTTIIKLLILLHVISHLSHLDLFII